MQLVPKVLQALLDPKVPKVLLVPKVQLDHREQLVHREVRVQ